MSALTTLRVSCVQLAARDAGQAAVALERALEAVDEAAGHGSDLILLPECVYPAYYLRPWLDRRDHYPDLEHALEQFCARAARHRAWVCVGLVEENEGALYNTAFLIDRRGSVAGKARKHFLWHFDSAWFRPGHKFDIFEVDARAGGSVSVGMFVCADGRLPEVARALALRGATLLLDPTNWVTYGRDTALLTNPQAEFMMSCRALENSVYIACANKIGMEKGSVLYCGRSLVVGPGGETLAMASADQEEILTCELGPFGPGGPVDGRLHPLLDRRPGVYGQLVEPTAPSLPSPAGTGPFFVALVQLELEPPGALERACEYARVMEEQGADLVVLGEPSPSAGWDAGEVLPSLAGVLGNDRTMVAVTALETAGRDKYKTLFLANRKRLLGSYRKVHLESDERETLLPGDHLGVLETGSLKLGSMLGYEGLLPEVARVLALQGADVVLWPRRMAGPDYTGVARTRAAENRVFVAVADNLASGSGFSAVADPSGRLLAPALVGTEQATLASLLVADARAKLVAPGTDPLRGRNPGCYRTLVSN
ncbi:MAG: carbon-nitrogen hydrolase family protein [Bacillota bacterium]